MPHLKKIASILLATVIAVLLIGVCDIEGLTQTKKVIFIIAKENFRDEELLVPMEILNEADIETEVASSSLKPARGMLGNEVVPDLLISDIDTADYDGIIFVGGIGASEYWHNERAHEIAREAIAQDKILGAICIAPLTLANAGVLENKSSTVWPSESKRLKACGAIYTGRDVQVDSKIITANGPSAAEEFGAAILEALEQTSWGD